MELAPSNTFNVAFASRVSGVLFGFSNQLLFLVTVYFLFWYLRDGSLQASHQFWWLIDTGLALLFAFSHSIMLYPAARKRLSRWIPAAFYDSLFCVVTCCSLLTLFAFWKTSPIYLWNCEGSVLWGVRFCFYASWIGLLYSLALTGLGYQTGWTPFYYWLRKQKPPKRTFAPKGAYYLLRHPVYLSFLGLIWFTPKMTLDHAVLTGIWTAYIFLGSMLKDHRLRHYVGAEYQRYASRIPGYPMMLIGPLGKWNEPSTNQPTTQPTVVGNQTR